MTPEWTDYDAAEAAVEGWGMFDCDGLGEVQVQAFDTQDLEYGAQLKGGDNEAWALVYFGPAPHHAKARAWIKDVCPEEWARIERYAQGVLQ